MTAVKKVKFSPGPVIMQTRYNLKERGPSIISQHPLGLGYKWNRSTRPRSS